MRKYSNSLCRKCGNYECKAYHGTCRRYEITMFFKRLFRLKKK